MSIQKKSFKFFFFTSLIFLVSYLLNFDNYIGSKFLFFIFNLSSYCLFLVAIKKTNNSAFEFFTYFFLLLSFWFKFNCILYFESIKITEGDFDLAISNYDNATYVITIVFAACICASFIKEFIIKKLNREIKFKMSNSFIEFYKTYRYFIFFLFSLFLILVWLTNFYYKIYSKGLVNEHLTFFVKHFYAWSLTYGLAVFTSVLIYIDFIIFNKSKIFIFGIFECFFTQMNIYSRSFLISFIAYLRGFLLLIKIDKFKLLKLNLLKLIFLILIIFFFSIFITTKLRNTQFYETDKFTRQTNIFSTLSEILQLSVNRWVGIDALLAVSQNKNLSFNFFLSAWQEKKNIKNKSFYIDNFFSRFNYSEFEKKNLNIVITPGIVAFLYYSGSALFVFFSILFLILICTAIELLFFYYSLGNVILVNIIGYALSIRFIHFGYVPINTINFLLSFLITFFLIYFLTNIIQKKNFKS
jgi:hypothetical protein